MNLLGHPQGLWSFKNDCKCSERLTIITKNDRADLKVNNVNVKKNRLENSYLEMPLIHSAGYRTVFSRDYESNKLNR